MAIDKTICKLNTEKKNGMKRINGCLNYQWAFAIIKPKWTHIFHVKQKTSINK